MFTNSYIIISSVPIEKTFLEKVKDFIILYKEFFYLLLFILLLCLFAYFLYKNYDLKKITSGNYKIILLFISFPFLFLLLIPIFRDRFTLDGWFSFLGGYVGVGGAVGTVWWQLNEEKKKKEQEKIEEEYKSLITLLIHIREISETYKDISLLYINHKNVKLNANILDYNISLMNQLLLKVNLNYRNFVIEIMQLFQGYSLKNLEVLNSSEQNILNTSSFYKEHKEIFNKLYIGVSVILINMDKFENEDILKERFVKIEERIAKIQERYPYYLDLPNHKPPLQVVVCSYPKRVWY